MRYYIIGCTDFSKYILYILLALYNIKYTITCNISIESTTKYCIFK